ncbi:hypothetical protein [Halomonas sp. LBP4]|uniref:hypothetical protein n=1 Tax=Halomonas sp. LBP4 TaxID=2044917 RepID=UPI0011B50DFE|nr:hypothetical protein [Halomonas sp. LBP4]
MPRPRPGRPATAGRGVELEWLVDDGSLELLLDGGRLAITQLSFAQPAGHPQALAVAAGECRVRTLEYRPLKAVPRPKS